MSGARWALRPLASASFSLRSGARRTLTRASSACVWRANAACAHTPAVASAARPARPPSRRVCSSSPVPAMTRHLARARGACFSSGGASLGGLSDGSSPAAIAGTPLRRARHVTHVSSLSDPLPEDVPSWTGQALEEEETDAPVLSNGGQSSASSQTRRREKRSPPSPPSLETASRTYAVPTASRIFCNRSLNMAGIAAVGFDMDYTLAMYKPETFETLAYAETKKKLVDVYGFPKEVLDLTYDHTYMVRGLVVDKKRGNVLKMDRHKYVKVARHGFEPLTTEERIATYCASTAKADQFVGPGYANVDTLFALGETYLFCQLVELKERYLREQEEGSLLEEETSAFEHSSDQTTTREPENSENDDIRRKLSLASKPFEKMYDEIRASVDLCHRDGTLKRAVAEDPGKYIHADDALVPMLRALRASGKKVFLLTNSLWDFTNVVMNFLVADLNGDAKTTEWMHLFDAVITGSCKPGFFENERAAIFEVDVETSDLRNTDDGAPMVPIGASEAEDAPFAGLASFSSRNDKKQKGRSHPRAYQGGSYRHLHAMLGVISGNQILYVGDHIYGDVMRSKKTLGWRTMLVVPELAHELKCLEDAEARGAPEQIRALRRERDALSDAAQLRRWRASVIRDASVEAGTGWSGGTSFGDEPSGVDGHEGEKDFENAHFFAADPELKSLTSRAAEAKKGHREKTHELHSKFHPVWGQLMKAGSQNSRFAHQLERYACLYTSYARNLVAYSPQKTYRGQSDFMPHDDLDGEHH